MFDADATTAPCESGEFVGQTQRVRIDPLSDVVIVRRSEPVSVSEGGIFLAYDADFKEDIGEVVFVGRGKRHVCAKCKTKTRVPVDVNVGDKIIFSTNGHQITNINGEELVVLREPSIIGVITDAA